MSPSFTSLGVPATFAEVLAAQGIESAFPIQEATLPTTLNGGDVLGRGQTGSGKTLAFSLPVVARLAADPKPRKARFPRALIMAPTRELATQIAKVVEPLAKAVDLRTAVVFGGVSQLRQEKDLNAGVDILIACPGRLEDLLKQRVADLSRVEISVLDEADHMADLGFLPVVKRILDQAPRGIQHMLFSATLDNGVDKLVQRYLENPTVHSVDAPTAAVNTMEHHVFLVSNDDKKELVRTLASGSGRRIMFMRTKHHAKKMAVWLSKCGIPTVDLHGNLSQNARDRNLAAFSAGDARVLVATDVAARGVHVDGVELVVHIDPPAEHKAYLHRSGRTARAGSDGTVVTIATPDQQSDVKSLMKAAGLKVPMVKVTPNAQVVSDVVGERRRARCLCCPAAAQHRHRPQGHPERLRRSRRPWPSPRRTRHRQEHQRTRLRATATRTVASAAPKAVAATPRPDAVASAAPRTAARAVATPQPVAAVENAAMTAAAASAPRGGERRTENRWRPSCGRAPGRPRRSPSQPRSQPRLGSRTQQLGPAPGFRRRFPPARRQHHCRRTGCIQGRSRNRCRPWRPSRGPRRASSPASNGRNF